MACVWYVYLLDEIAMMLIQSERDAMGDDEYHPISRKGTNLTEAGGIGYTVVDSIDTMLIMGLVDEYARARDWVANKMMLDRNANFNTFEVRIPT
jgi:endoplasmic reticulum Man9GlcNAc2 1,2-alpha-mannosidase